MTTAQVQTMIVAAANATPVPLVEPEAVPGAAAPAIPNRNNPALQRVPRG
jgi:hypothetical protein